METFNMAAAETKAPRPCLQITLFSQTIPLKESHLRREFDFQKRDLDGLVSVCVIIIMKNC